MTLPSIAAMVAASLCGLVVAFQAGLVAGLRLGEATMGGRAATVEGVLTPRYRVAAAVSGIILALAAWIVLARAEIVPIFIAPKVVAILTWIVAGFMALNTLSNLTGRHPLERWGMASVTLVVALLVTYVALAAEYPAASIPAV